MDLRIVLPLCALALGACRAAPVWEPAGGFELAPIAAEGWVDVRPFQLEGWLAAARAGLGPVRDYTATLETRERVEDEVFPRRVMHLKVREQPFAAAIETFEPPNEAGQRVWYDESRSDEIVAETPGFLGALVGRVSLDPEGDLAMKNRRHPITDLGLARLLAQVDGEFVPTLARRYAPRLRCTEAALAGTTLRFVDALVPGGPEEPSLLHRLGFELDSGLLTYYGLAEVLPDGLALVEEYLYRELRLNPGLGADDFRPEE
jgi:hypothetical protein